MALKDNEKPMLPLEMPPGHVPCADDRDCRKPGRLWFDGMSFTERVCIMHAYSRYERGERDSTPA